MKGKIRGLNSTVCMPLPGRWYTTIHHFRKYNGTCLKVYSKNVSQSSGPASLVLCLRVHKDLITGSSTIQPTLPKVIHPQDNDNLRRSDPIPLDRFHCSSLWDLWQEADYQDLWTKQDTLTLSAGFELANCFCRSLSTVAQWALSRCLRSTEWVAFLPLDRGVPLE